MTRTVVALYDDFESANAAVRELAERGFAREDISLMANDATGQYGSYINPRTAETPAATDGATEGAGVGAGIGAVIGGLGGLLVGLGALTIPGIGPVLAAGPLAAALTGLAGAGVGAVAGGVAGGILGALVDMGVPEESAQYYAEGIRRGGTLVTLRSSDEMTHMAVDILNRHNPVDINQRAAQWREAGWTIFNPQAEVRQANEMQWPAGSLHSQERPKGRVELDQPPAADAPMQTDHYVASSASNMYDTSDPSFRDFSYYEDDFRTHYQTSFTGSDYSYDQYQPAYRYGYDLATDERFRGYDWDRLEPEARRYWNERNPGTWESFKNAVRHAWEELKASVD